MINDVLSLLKNRLNAYFKLKAGTTDDKVLYIPGNKLEPLSFPNNQVTPIIINLEEDRTTRNPDPFRGVVKDGVMTNINPEIQMNVIVLFVSRFQDYDQGLRFLSLVVKYFQFHRFFDHQNAPELPPDIRRLQIELLSLPIQQQNELWNALRTSYIPSVAYRIRALIYNDEEAMELVSETAGIETDLKKL